MCSLYGEGAVTFWTCQKWFAKFPVADFSLDNDPQSGRPVEIDSNQIETLIENNQCYTMKQIIELPKISKPSIENHLYWLGYVNHFDVCVAHKLLNKTVFLCAVLYWNISNIFHFLNKLWQVMKSGYCEIMWNGRYHKASEMNHHQPHQRPVFIQRRWCVYGGLEGSPQLWPLSGKSND